MAPQAAEKYFKHDLAVVETPHVGERTRIWAFAHILPGARIGADCNICDHTFIENDVTIGDRVTIKCGVQVWDGITLENDVFVGPNATFTNDPVPRSRHYIAREHRPQTLVKQGASIGANATILPGLTIGRQALVGAGAVVTHNVPDGAIVVGNPASIKGYIDTPVQKAAPALAPESEVLASKVKGVLLRRLPHAEDLRGSLSFGEIGAHVPFPVRRYFVVYGVAGKEVRGEHAHRNLHQFLVCLHGSCHIVVDDGKTREEYALDHPTIGLYVPPMIWSTQYKHAEDTVLLVLASEPYDASEYIRDYSEFLRLTQQAP
jgi:UDP-2-acetamido-3-amino-2,3-dideoxy-glucuronate N-acetyltransferase